MAACKCRICKKSLNTKDAYCVITNDKRFYYCNATEYEEYKRKQEKEAADKDKVYRLICDIIGRKEIINSILWKEKSVWNKVCTDEVIAQYLEENKDYLTGAISKLDDVEFNRIRYLSAVLKNKLGDYKPKAKEIKIETQKQESVEMRDDFGIRTNNKKKITRRKGFSEMEG